MRSVVGTVLVVVCLSALILIHLVSVSSSDLPGKNSSPTRWYQLDSSYSFDLYKKEFHKKYESPQEETLRREIFTLKLKQILAHNSDSSSTWKMGVNQFTDRTKEEFSKVLGVRKDMLFESRESKERIERSTSLQQLKIQHKQTVDPYPPSVDWRARGVISAVKDQGQCGSCWSFASSETLESHWAIVTGELANLSEQQILDCTLNPKQCGGTGGCGGGTTEVAYQTIIDKQGGLSSEWTYPYNSYFGDNFDECDFSSQTPAVAMLESFTDLPSNLPDPVMYTLAYVGPLAISVDASGWDNYESGVFTGCNLQNPDLDHGVQLVGYGEDRDGNGDFWLVRNSWSAYWGESGYIRIAKSDNITCGVDLNPSDGDGCLHGPPNVTVCGPCGLLYDPVLPIVKIN